MANFFLALFLQLLTSVPSSFVLMKLWEWFVVPLGFPQIGMAWAYGLCVTASCLRYKPDLTGMGLDEAEVRKRLIVGAELTFIMLGFFFLVGWIAFQIKGSS